MLPYKRFSVKWVGFVEHFFTSYGFSQSGSNGAIALLHNFVILSMRNSYLALKSASTITDMIKKAANAADAIKNADLIDAIANLRLESAKLKSTLASAEERILEIKQENDTLKAKIKVLEQSAINLDKPTLRDGFYYSQDGDGPFCTVCYDKNKEFIRVIPLPSILVSTGMGKYKCQNCRTTY
jgi:hypothetical protein